MKRVCLVLLAVMTLMASFAAAEEAVTVKAAETFDITLELPELYELNEERINGILYATIASTQKETVYILTVAPSEEYAQRSISDMSKEEVEDLILAASEYFDTPVLDMTETASATELIVVKEGNAASGSCAYVMTVYHGYFIQLYVENQSMAELSDEQLQVAVDLLSGMEIVTK